MTGACAALPIRPAPLPCPAAFGAWAASAPARASAPKRRKLCTVAPVPAEEAELEAERQLVERAQSGDREALGQILRQHGPRLYRSVLYPRLGSAAAAEEALSVTYIKVVERFGQFTWQNVGVYPWLRVVAMRVALDALRARKREVLFEPADLQREIDSAETEDRSAEVIEKHDLAVARERVERALEQINPRYRRAITLRVLEGRSREEVARELEVSVSTFDVVLHRAMAALKKALALNGGDE